MILDPRRFKDFGLINKCVCFANICQQISNIREIQWYFVTFENDHVFSSDLISSHVTLRHWSIKVLSLMGGSLFCTFFKKVEKSCPKCFKKRFKSRSRWRLILFLNPNFGGFFSKFSKPEKNENHKVLNAGSETNAWTRPLSPAKIDYIRRRRREEEEEGGGLVFS